MTRILLTILFLSTFHVDVLSCPNIQAQSASNLFDRMRIGLHGDSSIKQEYELVVKRRVVYAITPFASFSHIQDAKYRTRVKMDKARKASTFDLVHRLDWSAIQEITGPQKENRFIIVELIKSQRIVKRYFVSQEKLPADFAELLRIITSPVSDEQDLVDSLQYVTDMPYICESQKPYDQGCGSEIFWRAVQRRGEIIPFLIDNISDSTSTAAYVPNLGGKYAVGDVAYFALSEIIDDIPTFQLLGVEFDEHGCGFCAYWNHLRKDVKNRIHFERSVRKWYHKNKSKLVWTADAQGRFGVYKSGSFRLNK